MFLYSNACIATAWFRLPQSIFLHFIAFFILKFNCFVCRSVFIHICASECLFPFVVDYVPLLHCSLYLWFRRFYISLHDCASLQACCTCGSDWQTFTSIPHQMLVVSVVQTVSIPHYRPVVSMVQTETDYILCSVQTVVDCVSILHYRPAVSVVQTVVDCVSRLH